MIRIPFFPVVCSLLAVMLAASCDQKSAAPAKPVEKAKKKVLASPDTLFQEGREKLMAGQFDDAADSLGQIAAEQKVRQPLLNWIDFHQGLALFLAGRSAEARDAFGKIEERGPFTKAGSEASLASFFVSLAHELHDKAPTPAAAGKDYDKWSYEGIALLALGAKDWNLDQYEEAAALFRQFGDVQPEKMVDWADGPPDLAKLKEIAKNFVNDYTEYTSVDKGLEAATTPEDQQVAIDKAKAARGRMKLTTKLSKALDAKLADLSPKVAAVLMAKSQASAEEIAADAKALADGKQKRAELMAKFQFAKAHDAIADAPVKLEKSRDEQEELAKKAEWLANFKSQLIEDLNKSGYAKPVARKSGETFPGGITQADDQQVLARGARGNVAVPWPDIALDSDFAMGASFIQPDMPPELAAFRKWHLGVFGIYAGKRKEGLALLHEAADLKAVYKDELPRFEKPSETF